MDAANCRVRIGVDLKRVIISIQKANYILVTLFVTFPNFLASCTHRVRIVALPAALRIQVEHRARNQIVKILMVFVFEKSHINLLINALPFLTVQYLLRVGSAASTLLEVGNLKSQSEFFFCYLNEY